MRTVLLCFVLLALAAPAAQASGPPPDAGAAVQPGVDLTGSAARSVPTEKAITTLYTRRVTTAVQHEVETAITALTIGGVDYTIGASMNNYSSSGYPDSSTANWEIRTRYSTNLTSWSERIPAKPTGSTRTVDPVLAANVYSGGGSGISPNTVYLGGLGTAGVGQLRKIAVWRSTDGGNVWSTPTTVAQTNSSVIAVDKPTIAVSWYPNPNIRGSVFVAYLVARRQSQNRSQNELFVARSTDGGVTFATPVLVAQSYLHTPQVLVSSGTGKVYVVYTDHDRNKIRLATSIDQGANWTIEDVSGPTGTFLEVWDDPFINGGGVCNLQAITVPHARYNWVRDSIGIVWHEKETEKPSSSTDVWFIAKTASGWTNKVRVNPTQTNDQWMPALDFDSAGNYVIVYYDRSADASNILYKEAWAQLNPLYPTPSILTSGLVHGAFASNPTTFNQTFNGVTTCFKGEYQDIWYWPYSDATGGRFNSIWTGSTSSTVYDNVYLSGLKP